jgi:2'-5' RNA ligase
MSFRSFISVDIDAGPELVNVCKDLKDTRSRLKVVDPRILHITLKFLGDIEERLVPEIVSVMRDSVEGIDPFHFDLRGVGAFPNSKKIRVVWVGIPDPGPMPVLVERLEEGLSGLGFEKERREFRPHLTVARAKDPRGMEEVREIMNGLKDHHFGTQDVSSIRLKKSILGPKGPTYSTVEEVAFGPRG